MSVDIGDPHPVSGQWTAHRSDLHLLPRRIPAQRGGLGLAVAVTDGQAPGGLHLIDHLGIERLAGAADLAQRHLEARQLLLDEQPPHRRRRAQRRHAAAPDSREQCLGVEARLIDHEHRRAGIPGREQTAPGVLGPAGRGDVQMDIAGLQPEPIHRRQSADGITALAVPHQLWFCRGARGEIQQHRIVGLGGPVRLEGFRRTRRFLIRQPALMLRRRADHDADQLLAAEAFEFRDLVLRRHHHLGPATIEPVAQFVRRQQRGGGDHHHAKLHRRQHGLPQRDDIAEQQQQMIAALETLRTQEVCDLIGATRQRLER